jgi:hypothetical protein
VACPHRLESSGHFTEFVVLGTFERKTQVAIADSQRRIPELGQGGDDARCRPPGEEAIAQDEHRDEEGGNQ